MGIPKFGKQVLDKYVPKASHSTQLSNEDTENIHHILFDFNGCIHEATRKSQKRRSKGGRKGQIHSIMILYRMKLDKFLARFRSSKALKTVSFCLDGSAPIAKLLVQKQRREKQREGSMKVEITPGSQLMNDINLSLLHYAVRSVSRGLLNNEVKYYISSSSVPGEGESKMFQFINSRKGENCMIVSGDSDLFMYSLASGNTSNTCIFNSNCHKIRRGRLSVHDMTGFQSVIDRFHLLGKRDRILYDFSFLLIFYGNDYLPALPHHSSIVDHYFEFKKKEENRDVYLILSKPGTELNINYKLFSNILGSSLHQGKLKQSQMNKISEDDISANTWNYMKGVYWCSYLFQTGKVADYFYVYGSRCAPPLANLYKYALFLSVKTNRKSLLVVNNEKPLTPIQSLTAMISRDQAVRVLPRGIAHLSESIFDKRDRTQQIEALRDLVDRVKQIDSTKYKMDHDILNRVIGVNRQVQRSVMQNSKIVANLVKFENQFQERLNKRGVDIQFVDFPIPSKEEEPEETEDMFSRSSKKRKRNKVETRNDENSTNKNKKRRVEPQVMPELPKIRHSKEKRKKLSGSSKSKKHSKKRKREKDETRNSENNTIKNKKRRTERSKKKKQNKEE